MNDAFALFSGSPLSPSNLLKPARKRKNYKKAKTFLGMSCDAGSYKVLMGSFGDVEYKKRRIQPVENNINTGTGFIQYFKDEFEGQTLSKHPGHLWQSNFNQAPNKDRAFTNRDAKQDFCSQIQPESVLNALRSQSVNCQQSVANAEKKCQAACGLDDTSNCTQGLMNTNEVVQLDSFSLIFYDIINTASMYEHANSESATQSQGYSVPMTMSHGIAPVKAPLTSSNPLPVTVSQGLTSSSSLMGNSMPKAMSQELTSQRSSKGNSGPLTMSKIDLLEARASNKRYSEPMTATCQEVTPWRKTSRNSVVMTASQLQSENQSQQLNTSMQWKSNHSDLEQPRHSQPLAPPRGQSLNQLISAQYLSSSNPPTASFKAAEQMKEDMTRNLQTRIKECVDFLTGTSDTFQEMFKETTNSTMPGGCIAVQTAYTTAPTEKLTATAKYTNTQQNYMEAQSMYITGEPVNTQCGHIPSTYNYLSNTQLSNIHTSFRQITKTQPMNPQSAYNQTANMQPSFRQITNTQPANTLSLQIHPSSTQTSNIQTSFRQTTNTQPMNSQSIQTHQSNPQSSFKQTINTQPTNLQSIQTHPSNTQTSSIQTSFRQTTNTQPANPQTAYFRESTTFQPAANPTQEPIDYLLTPTPYSSSSNNATATLSANLSAQPKTQNFGNGPLSNPNTLILTLEQSTPDFTSLSNLPSFPISPEAEDDLLSSNNDSFYLDSTPSMCFA